MYLLKKWQIAMMMCVRIWKHSVISGTPAWYYKRWPGFLNVESYKILDAWDKGVRTEEGWLRDLEMEEEKGEQEDQELQFILETD